MIFISVNTPKNQGNWAGQASDLKWVEACAEVAMFAQVIQ